LVIQLGVPLWAAIAGVVVGLWLQYIIGIWLVMRSVDAERLNPEDHIDSLILEMVESMADELSVKTPRVYYGEMHGPNAFAIGRRRKGRIVLSPLLLEVLTPEEMQAVLAHELSHLRSNDITPMLIGESLAIVLEIVVAALLSPIGGKRNVNESIGETVHLLVLLLVRGISREREFLADGDAKTLLGDGEPLAGALYQITRAYQEGFVSAPPARVESLCFAGDWGLSAAYATHPPMDARVDRLLEIEE
jgi:heat shock protein HtpX